MSSLLFIDCETTHLSADHGAMVELSAIAIINGEFCGQKTIRIKPHEGAKIDPEALKITKFTVDQINSFQDPSTGLREFIEFVDSFECKFRLAGHNIGFDRRFLFKTMCRHGFYFEYNSRFRQNYVCTYEMAKKIGKKKLKVESLKLGTLCEALDIRLENAHSAADDIKATYELYEKLKPMMPVEVKVKKTFKTYYDKRLHYLDMSLIQFNPEGGVYIDARATCDPIAMQFIVNELYDLYCDDGIIDDTASESSQE